MAQTLSEMETHLNMTADNRSLWEVFSDDEVMQRKMEKIGATLVREESSGGKHYTLRSDQVTFRAGKRQLSDERKAELATRMRSLRKNTRIRDAE